jgi:fumarate reductase flavoprotein subunit
MNDIEYELIIIGGGASGLAAAVAAAERGVRVAVFEKSATTGGAANMGMGLLAVESRLQKLKQIALTREDAFKIFMDFTHWQVDARLVKAYIDKSATTIEWLERMGVEFIAPEAFYPGANFTWHVVRGENGRGGPGCAGSMMKKLSERARELGVKFYLQTPVKRILKAGNLISGVLAEDQRGENLQVKGQAVIIASGGIGDNPEWIKKYTGYEWGKDLFSFRIPGMNGDGIRMAWEMNAASDGIRMELTYSGIPGLNNIGPGGAPFVFFMCLQPNLIINLLGERFVDESIIGNTTFMGNAISIQKNRCAVNIFDDNIKEYYLNNGLDFLNGVSMNGFEAHLKEVLDSDYKYFFAANSLDELAATIQIDQDVLKKTIAEYNCACDTGRDELFNKSPKYLRPIKSPKYYAGMLFPSGYGSLGGIRINYKTEVLAKDNKVIPGLYASGVDACSIFGDSYCFLLPGNTMGFAINSGRIAGENGADYIKANLQLNIRS